VPWAEIQSSNARVIAQTALIPPATLLVNISLANLTHAKCPGQRHRGRFRAVSDRIFNPLRRADNLIVKWTNLSLQTIMRAQRFRVGHRHRSMRHRSFSRAVDFGTMTLRTCIRTHIILACSCSLRRPPTRTLDPIRSGHRCAGGGLGLRNCIREADKARE